MEVVGLRLRGEDVRMESEKKLLDRVKEYKGDMGNVICGGELNERGKLSGEVCEKIGKGIG